MITFANIKYIIYIGVVTLIVLTLFVLYLFWKKRILLLLARGDTALASLIKRSPRISRLRSGLILAAVPLFALTLLRPQWGDLAREVKSEGSDVLIALDVSNSMLTRDIEPSRLERAKNAVRWIAESLKGDRIGLILFAGDAFLQCPLTNDTGAFMMFLDAAAPDAIRLQGTDLGRALAEARRVFKKKRLTSKILVLITDGEDHEGQALAAAEQFQELGVSIYTVGVGRESGDYIPVPEEQGSGDNYYRDTQGKLIRSSRNPDILKKIAALSRGSYIDISEGFSGLRFILEIIEDQQKNEYKTRIVKEKIERYQIFALLLLIIISAELMLPERGSVHRGRNRN